MIYSQLIKLTLFVSLFFHSFQFIFGSEALLPVVLVTQGPHKFFVEKIAGNTVTVSTVVPNGVSAHSFEPNAKQILALSKAVIWFQTGETFEKKASPALRYQNPKLDLVDLRQGLNLIYGGCGNCHCHCGGEDAADLHIWVSPKMVKIQAQTIAQALIAHFPANKDLYLAHLQQFQKELDQLDLEIQEKLQNQPQKMIVVSHPSYSYFCRDYNLVQISLEVEGKDPTPQQLTKLLKLVKDSHVKTIFIQPQYGRKAADLIAKQIGAQVVSLDPYSEHYFETMHQMAEAFGAL